MTRWALIAVCAALVAGCGSSGGSSTTLQAVVNWAPHPPPAPARAARACSAADLRATPDLSGSTGGLSGTMVLRNASSTPCSLSGTPTVRLTPKLPQAPTGVSPTPSALPASWLRSLSGAHAAAFPLILYNWCFPKQTPTAVVTLPGGHGSLSVPLHEAPRCIVAATPTTVSVGQFEPAVVPGPPFTKLALSARIVPAQPSSDLGEPLRYDVKLTNNSQSTLHFGPCPLVRQQFGTIDRVDVLNCKPAGDIGPGRSVGFRMELPIPSATPSPPQILTWTLDPFSTRPVRATAQATAG